MEQQCEVCGENAELVEVIGGEKIMDVCGFCARKGGYPVIKKASSEQFSDMSRFRSVRERLMEATKGPVSIKTDQDKELERIVAQNVKAGNYDDLVDNFDTSLYSLS